MKKEENKEVEKTQWEKFYDIIAEIDNGDHRLSFSAFSNFIDCPLAFYDYKMKKKEQTDAMFRGKVLHSAILEPETFDEVYAVEPEAKPSSPNQVGYCQSRSEGRNQEEAYFENYKAEKIDAQAVKRISAMEKEYGAYIEYLAEKGDRESVSASLYDEAMRTKDRVYMNPTARWLLYQGIETEKKIEWELGGFKWHGYIDLVGESVRVDLKFLKNAKPKKLRWEVYDSNYHLQVGNFYSIADKAEDGSDKVPYVLAINPMGYCTVVEIEEKDISSGWRFINEKLADFKRCIFKREFHRSYDFWQKRGVYKLRDL